MASPVIEARDLRKRFGCVQALDGLDLVAESGEVTALLGPNGAGKTTFVSAVATLLAPDDGVLRVAGVDVAAEPRAVRRVIGLAGQSASIEPAMTGTENLRWVARLFGLDGRAARRAALEVLERIGLVEAGDRLVRTYSGGMRRRLDLGASLVGRPQLLLLDEPTTGLDPRSRIELWNTIRALVADGTDVLLTTQYLEEADQLAHHVVIVDHGHVIAAGAPDELKVLAGRDVIEVRPHRAADLPAVEEVLAAVGAETSRPDLAKQRASAAVDRGPELMAVVLRLLDERTIPIDDIGLRRPTLDDVFLTLTGQPAAPGTNGSHRTTTTPEPLLARRISVASLGTAPEHAAPVGPRPSGAALPAATCESARRTVLKYLRTPQLLVLLPIQCGLFLFIFRYIFGGAIATGSTVAYVDFIATGFIVTVILWSAMYTPAGVAEDAASGVHDRLRSLPIPPTAVMAGWSLADTALGCWTILTTTALALAFGFRTHGDAPAVLLAGALLVAAAYAFSWVFISLGLVAGNAQAAQGMATLIVVPFSFVSNAFVPTDALPDWMQPVASHQPVTVIINAVRCLTLGGTDAAGVGNSTGHWLTLSLIW